MKLIWLLHLYSSQRPGFRITASGSRKLSLVVTQRMNEEFWVGKDWVPKNLQFLKGKENLRENATAVA